MDAFLWKVQMSQQYEMKEKYFINPRREIQLSVYFPCDVYIDEATIWIPEKLGHFWHLIKIKTKRAQITSANILFTTEQITNV